MRSATAAVSILQGAALLVLAPLLPGILARMRARLQGRRGPSLWQPYFSIAKNLRKESLVPEDSTWIFRHAPAVMTAAAAIIALAVPAVFLPAAASFSGDVLALVFLLALIRFCLALAALDTGTSFAGLGASREMSLSSLVEPATILAVFALAISAGSTDLGHIASQIAEKSPFELGPSHLLAFGSLAIVTLAETGRVPVDNPTTHLELTMIHEAMILEYSGWRLALIEYVAALKLLIFLSLLATLFLPWGVATSVSAGSLLLSVLVFTLKLALILVAIAAIEAGFAKLRLFRVPDLIGAALMLAILAVVAIYIGLG